MLFSGKITNSTVVYLEKEGVDLQNLHELTDIPEEFLREPTYWLEADKVEAFLARVSERYHEVFVDPGVSEQVGDQSYDLRAWGVLDSVLRMMKSPKDIYHYPQRFISYFVSPPPPIGSLTRSPEAVEFDFPISSEEYPMVCGYLKAVMGSLPRFMGRPAARAHWQGHRISVNWSTPQVEFFRREEEKAPIMSPEVVQSLMTHLESLEKEVERKNMLLKNQEMELRHFRNHEQGTENSTALAVKDQTRRSPTMEAGEDPLNFVKDQLMRLNDYFYRAQQIVTMLSAKDSKPAQFKMIARRLDWDRVRTDFPKLIEECVERVGNLRAEPPVPPPVSSSQMDMFSKNTLN